MLKLERRVMNLQRRAARQLAAQFPQPWLEHMVAGGPSTPAMLQAPGTGTVPYHEKQDKLSDPLVFDESTKTWKVSNSWQQGKLPTNSGEDGHVAATVSPDGPYDKPSAAVNWTGSATVSPDFVDHVNKLETKAQASLDGLAELDPATKGYAEHKAEVERGAQEDRETAKRAVTNLRVHEQTHVDIPLDLAKRATKAMQETIAGKKKLESQADYDRVAEQQDKIMDRAAQIQEITDCWQDWRLNDGSTRGSVEQSTALACWTETEKDPKKCQEVFAKQTLAPWTGQGYKTIIDSLWKEAEAANFDVPSSKTWTDLADCPGDCQNCRP